MSSAANAACVQRLYRALQQRDGIAMAACYQPQAHFRDPVFDLRGARIGAMWRMLCARGAGLRVEVADLQADETTARAGLQAWYTFSASGRPVHNVIQAHFRFVDGLIVEHVDCFDFWRWSRQALGPAALLLGWSPLLRSRVRRRAEQALAQFEARPAG